MIDSAHRKDNIYPIMTKKYPFLPPICLPRICVRKAYISPGHPQNVSGSLHVTCYVAGVVGGQVWEFVGCRRTYVRAVTTRYVVPNRHCYQHEPSGILPLFHWEQRCPSTNRNWYKEKRQCRYPVSVKDRNSATRIVEFE